MPSSTHSRSGTSSHWVERKSLTPHLPSLEHSVLPCQGASTESLEASSACAVFALLEPPSLSPESLCAELSCPECERTSH